MSSSKKKVGMIVGLILAYICGVGGSVLAFVGHLAERADDGGVATVFAIALPILGLIAVITLIVQESARALAPGWV